jgi:hypothetical protein
LKLFGRKEMGGAGADQIRAEDAIDAALGEASWRSRF